MRAAFARPAARRLLRHCWRAPVRRLCSSGEESVPPQLLRRLAALDGLGNRMGQLELTMEKRRRELEEELFVQANAIMQRRHAIVSGADEPTDQEVAESHHLSNAPDVPVDPDAPELERGVPRFWPTAMQGCQTLTVRRNRRRAARRDSGAPGVLHAPRPTACSARTRRCAASPLAPRGTGTSSNTSWRFGRSSGRRL